MILEVSHRTLYRYSAPVSQSQHLVHMSPRVSLRQITRRHSLTVEPAPASRTDGIDAFGNPVVSLDIESSHKEFVLLARSTVETALARPINLAATSGWDQLDTSLNATGFGSNSRPDLEVIQYRCLSRLTPASLELADYAAASFQPGRPTMEACMDLVRRVYADFKFDPTATDISTPVSQVFKQRRGVCQDFSHLTLAALRSHRVPCRYVSGYILTRPPPGQPKLQGTDASHAWISAWAPETGWVDFDPTNGLIVGDEHVTIAHGRDYNDVSPISGVLIGGGAHTVSVAVDVRQL